MSLTYYYILLVLQCYKAHNKIFNFSKLLSVSKETITFINNHSLIICPIAIA